MLDIIVIFNNPFPRQVEAVRRWYEPLGDVCIATPVDGGGDVIYETGSFTWQAAVVAALRKRERRHEHTLVLHDDVVLRPGLDVLSLLGDDPASSALCHSNWVLATPVISGWTWSLRVALGWEHSMHHEFGMLADDCAAVLKNSLLYQRNEAFISTLPEARLAFGEGGDPRRPWAEELQKFLPARKGHYWFGLPLRFGVSDYFTFPNRISVEVEDFFARTVRCSLFSELAVPTMLGWSGLQLVSHPQRFDDRWSDDRSGLEFHSEADIRAYFESAPELIGAHPIKFSRLFSSSADAGD